MTKECLQDAKILYEFLSAAPAAEQADFILAAGSHDLRVADHTAALYHEGAAPLIVCSGGYGKMTAGRFEKPEAELFAARCISRGVPPQAVLIENRSTNTGENFRFTHELLDEYGIFPKTGIVSCKPYMAKRVWATGTKQWNEVKWFVSAPVLTFEEYPTEETPLESSIQLMAGDLQRCRVYAEYGFQADVDIPEKVWAAYLRLANAGYDDFVIRDI